jgi:hypothetical protein
MRRTMVALAAAVVALTSGCTVSRPGTLEMLPSGPVIPVTVSVEGDTVAVRGQNAVTGERFEGRLAKVVAQRTSTGWYSSSAGPTTPMPSGIAATGSSGTERTIDVAGDLDGDQGTKLRCAAQVERRLLLTGGGICRVEGQPEGAPTYRLRF